MKLFTAMAQAPKTRAAAWLIGGLMVASSVSCGVAPTALKQTRTGAVAVKSRALTATVAPAASVPEAILANVLPRAQRHADDMSRRRKIDFFALHANPVGLKFQVGAESTYLLSLLGTATTRTDLNIEMRALLGDQAMGLTANYTGPATLTRAASATHRTSVKGDSVGRFSFDLIVSAPPAHVDEAHGRLAERMARHLSDRYDARPFEIGSDALAFSVEHDGATVGYVVCDQRDQLVLGDRKYADVQLVTVLGLGGELLAGYALVGFNEKTQGMNAPVYRVHDDAPLPIFEFGDY